MKSSVTTVFTIVILSLIHSSVVWATEEVSPGTQLSQHLFEEIGMKGNSDSMKVSNEDQSTLVKRSGARPYSFGLGKKSMPSSLSDVLNEARLRNDLDLMETESSPRNEYYDDGSDNFDTFNGQRLSDKRSSGQGIRGLIGKPGSAYSFGLGKRTGGWMGKLSSLSEPAYLGDIKRRYSFGLGK